MNFKPIETAPRDGSLIGAWSARERGVIRIVRWGQHWVPVPQKVPAPPPTGGNVEGEKG